MNIPTGTAADTPTDSFDAAVAQFQAGQYAQATESAQACLKERPQDHAAIQLLGVIALAQNRLQEAAELFKRALSVTADQTQAALSWMGLGQALRKVGDLRQAEEAFRRATLSDPANPACVMEFAQTLWQASKLETALDVLRNALRRNPQDTRAAILMGNLLVQSGMQDEGLAVFERVLQQEPDNAAAHFNRSTALTMLGKLEEAAAACEKALELDPKMDGYYHLSNLRTLTPDDKYFKYLQSWAQSDNDAPIISHIDRCFALANAYEAQAEYDRAFEMLLKANSMKRSTLVYSIDADEARMQSISRFFTSDFFARFSGTVESDLAPIFIIGMPRSGSTLVEQIFAAYPGMRSGGEIPYLLNIARHIGETWGSRGEASPGDDAAVIDDLTKGADTYTSQTAALHPDNGRFTDKLLGNYQFVGLIHLMFPKARIIHCLRDPVDTCLSSYKHVFSTDIRWSYDLVELGRYYQAYAKLMQHWHAVLPGRILDVQYEAMVADPEKEIRRLLDYCGLEFDPRCLDFHNVERTVTTASAMQVKKPMYSTAVGRWVHYRAHLDPLLTALGLPAGTPGS